MKHKSNYSKVMAAFYICIGYLATLMILEIICFLTFYPMLEEYRGLRVCCNIVWLYAGTFAYYKLTHRYTKWWKKLENEKNEHIR